MSCQVMYQSYYPYFPTYHPPPPPPNHHHQSENVALSSPHRNEESPVSPVPGSDRQSSKSKYSSIMHPSSVIRDSSENQETTSSSPYGLSSSSESYHHHNIQSQLLPESAERRRRRGSKSPSSPRRRAEEDIEEAVEDERKDNNSALDANEEGLEDEEDKNGSAQYLTANCVIYTYFNGDPARVVDEHFSRALGEKSKVLPLSQRNFPASFWNSDYQYPLASLGHLGHSHPHHHPPSSSGTSPSSSNHAELYSHDPYANSPLLGGPCNDSWQNYMAAAGSYSAHHPHHHHHHRGMHDMYSASRLNPQYSSLLLQSTVRQGRASHGLGKSENPAGSSWTTPSSNPTHHHPAHHNIVDNYNAPNTHYNPMTTGLEGTMPSSSPSSKDLYWF